MPAEITMPQLSDTMTEGTIVKWVKKEGDVLKAGDIVAEVETDKATMEMETFDGGTLAAILINDGEKAPVGAAIALIAKAGEKPEDVKKQGGAKTSLAQSPGAKPTEPAPTKTTAQATPAPASASAT
jgi:pyruvate dehydrogenase E2 component (dihydrolipoamide acetyltransferase)